MRWGRSLAHFWILVVGIDEDIVIKKYIKMFIGVLIIYFILFFIFLTFFQDSRDSFIEAFSFTILCLFSYLIVLTHYLIELTKRYNSQVDKSDKND